MNQAEAVIDELLEWSDSTLEPNLTQIEAKVRKLRKRLGEQMALEVINAQEARQPMPGPRCPTCQQEMRYKGQKEYTEQDLGGGQGPFDAAAHRKFAVTHYLANV